MKHLVALGASLWLAGCSVVGQSDVENAPYTLVQQSPSQDIEVRNYETMVLVSTQMIDGETNQAFRRLFNYIAGANQGQQDIAMTAPVLMGNSPAKGTEIAMTAPVLFAENQGGPVMSFVMPAHFTLGTTPTPTDARVWVSEVTSHKVAAITFSWLLSDDNVARHTTKLLNWLDSSEYRAVGEPVEAAYNGPMTLPMFRRNEILIRVEAR